MVNMGSQMIDGLALGETTPGPLIMVVAFVGFIGASTQEVFGPDLPLLAGIAGAGVATLFFAWHVLWPGATDAAPFAGGFEWFAAVVSVAAFVALVKFKRDVLKVIGASAVLGLCYTFATG